MKHATVKTTIEAVAGKPVSVGVMVKFTGYKRIWKGSIIKPWTWLRFETVQIVEPVAVDHVAVIRVDKNIEVTVSQVEID